MESAEVKEYTKRAAQLRSEGRLEEAVLAARKATSLDASDANSWWQLALALGAKDGGDSALVALQKVTVLAPDFAPGWNELARTHLKAKRRGEAVGAFEQALEADPSHIPSMRMLAYLLKGSEEGGASERRLALLREVFERDELDAEDSFDLAFLLAAASETSEAVKVYEHHTRLHDEGVAFFNLALCYRTLSRDADALDALNAASDRDYPDSRVNSVRPALQNRLQLLRAKVMLKPAPYLPRDSWFRHYINPFTLLNVEPEDIEDNAKALQKARQALLREIELEDGKVDWMPGLVIDKSTAMARLVELDDADAWCAHREVFCNRALNEFLMRGDLAHFLISEDGSTEAQLPHLLDAELLEHIGPKFAAQYDEVLSQAVEQADLVALECLLDGRRWVSPAQQEACFESTRRLLTRLCEPLKQVAETAAKRAVTRAEIDRAFNHGSLGNLLALLPIEFYEIHSGIGVALRSLSVSYYNRERDAEGAKAILAMGRACAQKSKALAHQMEADEKILDGFIAEEKSQEAHLSFKDKDVRITKTGVVFGKQHLVIADITGLRWGLVQTSAQPPIYRLSIAFQARRGEDIVVSWTVSSNLDEQKKLWGALIDATMSFIMDPVLANFRSEVRRTECVRVGSVYVFRDGVELIASGWFSDKKVRVPWSRLSSTLANGSVLLSDAENHKAKAELPLESTYNAFLLHMLATRKEHTDL
jgi:tetratricopeptide (TPR) repeat protein